MGAGQLSWDEIIEAKKKQLKSDYHKTITRLKVVPWEGKKSVGSKKNVQGPNPAVGSRAIAG